MHSRKILGLILIAVAVSRPAQARSFLEWPGLRAGPHPVGFRMVETVDRTRTIQTPTNYFGAVRPNYGQLGCGIPRGRGGRTPGGDPVLSSDRHTTRLTADRCGD